MVFCNDSEEYKKGHKKVCHNPYFNRWFSAITVKEIEEYLINGHNPYFNRWFSAIILSQPYQ